MDESWNPEPPPEIAKIQKENLIGDTLFSKHWLFHLLLQLINKVEDETEPSFENENKEIEPEFEKDLCDLWDMTVENDVCVLLDEYNAIQIFEGYIRKYDVIYPRAIEILIGILVNMATVNQHVCLKIVKNNYLIQYLLFDVMNKMDDVPTIIQVVKLFDIFVTTQNKIEHEEFSIKQIFVNYLKNELYFDIETEKKDTNNLNWKGIIEKLYFILEQSLNTNLIDSTCTLLLDLLDSDDQILIAFSSDSRIVDSICSAALTRFNLNDKNKNLNTLEFTTSELSDVSLKTPSILGLADHQEQKVKILTSQVSQEDISTIDRLFNKFFLCLQTLSTCELGAYALFNKTECIINIFDNYLEKCVSKFNDWEIKSAHSLKASIIPESIQNLVCITSVLNCLIPDNKSENILCIENNFNNFFQKLFTLCKYYLSYFNEPANHDICMDSSDLLSVNFSLARNNIKELFQNVLILKENKILKNLIQTCVSLL